MSDDKVIKIGRQDRERVVSNAFPNQIQDEQKDIIHCSFCGKSNREVLKMVKGPNANICSDCTMVAVQYLILNDRMPTSDSQKILDTFWKKGVNSGK